MSGLLLSVVFRTPPHRLKSALLNTLDPVQQEMLGPPDPLALTDVGTYSPPVQYRSGTFELFQTSMDGALMEGVIENMTKLPILAPKTLRKVSGMRLWLNVGPSRLNSKNILGMALRLKCFQMMASGNQLTRCCDDPTKVECKFFSGWMRCQYCYLFDSYQCSIDGRYSRIWPINMNTSNDHFVTHVEGGGAHGGLLLVASGNDAVTRVVDMTLQQSDGCMTCKVPWTSTTEGRMLRFFCITGTD